MILPAFVPLAAAREIGLSGLDVDAAAPIRLPPILTPSEDEHVARDWDIPGRVVIGFRGDVSVAASAVNALASTFRAQVARVDATLGFAVVEVDPSAEALLLKTARQSPLVAYAHRDGVARASFVPNDARYGEQWGPSTIEMPAAWDVTRGNASVMVAIVDTGVDATHPDLAPNFCVVGPDYPNGDSDAADDHGHGTHVAGTVAARIDNALGVAGMADACLMSVKVLDGGGFGSWTDVASGIVWATDNGADIISMSLGGCPACDPGAPVSDAVTYAETNGVLVVAAAGNAYCQPVGYPAAYPTVLAVASLSSATTTSDFSSCGPEVDVAAPGSAILSTSLTSGPLSDPSGYMYLDGTSMATPHVSGVAALVLSQHPTLSPSDLRCLLMQTADDILASGDDGPSGWGRVDAAAALATGACVPMPPSAPQLAATAGDASVTLTWTTPEVIGPAVTELRLYRGADAGSVSLIGTFIPGTDTATDTDVVNGQTYVYRISAVNSVGEGPLSSPVSATPMTPLTLPVTLDVEGSLAGWTMDGLWHVTTDRSASATHSLYYGIENGDGLEDNTYDTGVTNSGAIVSPAILLDASMAGLTFWHHWEGEGGSYEHPIVQVSTQGANGPWMNVYEDIGQTGGGVVETSLNAYVGETIHLRFLWDTKDPIANNFEGWYVDDITISSDEATIECDGAVDSYGYTCTTGGLAFEDISAIGTPLLLGDDGLSPPIAMGFPLTFYGVSRETATLSSNGFVTFSDDADNAGCCEGQPIPSSQTPDEFAAGFWTDLYPAPETTIHYATLGDAPSRVFIAQWTNAQLYGQPGALNTFQVKVFENGTIEAHVSSVSTSNGNAAVIGIEDCNGDVGLQAIQGSFALANVSFRFTPPAVPGVACVPPIPNDPPVVTIVSPEWNATVSGEIVVNGTAFDPDALDAVESVSLSLQPTDGSTGPISIPVSGTTDWSALLDTTQFLDGAYVIQAVASDGQEWGFATHTVHFANNNTNSPPTIEITTPQEGETISGYNYISGTSSDPEDGEPQTIEIRVNGQGVPWQGTASSWFIVLNTSQYPDGALTVDAFAYDSWGAGASDTATFNVQNGGGNGSPVATITWPSDSETISGVVDVTGVAADPESDPIYQVAIVVDGDQAFYAPDVHPWTVTLDTTWFANGWHTIDAWAYDGATWWWGDTVTVFIDNGQINEPPTVSISTPCYGCSVLGDVYASGTATDDDGDVITGVYYSVDGGSYQLANGTDSWYVVLSGLSVGSHMLYVYAEDGGMAQLPTPVSMVQFYVQAPPNAAPSVDITTPIFGELVDGRVRVEGVASDPDAGDAVVLVQARVDDGAWLDVGNGDDWAFYWDTEATYDGWHTIEARAFDGEDWSDVASVSVEVENPHAPVVSIVWPCCGYIVGGVISVGGFVSDGDGDNASVELRVDGGAWLPTTRYGGLNGTGYWNRYVDTRLLPDGLHDLEARAFDGMAHSAIVLAQVVVDNTIPTPPALAIDAPEVDGVVSGLIEIRGRAFDPEGSVSRVEVSIDGGSWRTAFGTSDWSLPYDTRVVSDGWHSVAARAVDDEGTSAYEFVYFRVDNRPDLVVEALSVADGAIETDLASAPHPIGPRDVIVAYANDGVRAARNVTLEVSAEVEVTPGVYSQELICRVYLGDVAGGASLEQVCRWDPTGTLGDVVLLATIDVDHAEWETNEQNNAKSVRGFVGVGGIGHGLMLPL